MNSINLSLPQVDPDNVVSGLLNESVLMAKIAVLNIPIFQRAIRIEDHHDFTILDNKYKFALPVTFTPYASVKPCSARCWFCSENLEISGASIKASSIRPGSDYQGLLRNALDYLKFVPLGLSLSGLEMTDDADWLLATLSTLKSWEDEGGRQLARKSWIYKCCWLSRKILKKFNN